MNNNMELKLYKTIAYQSMDVMNEQNNHIIYHG